MILLKFLWVKRDYSSESESGSKKKHAWVMMEEQFKKTFGSRQGRTLTKPA